MKDMDYLLEFLLRFSGALTRIVYLLLLQVTSEAFICCFLAASDKLTWHPLK